MNNNEILTPQEEAFKYVINSLKTDNVSILKIPTGKVFECTHIRSIPLRTWILLKFKKSLKHYDCYVYNNENHTTVIYAKSLFKELYIMKEEHYIDGKLVYSEKLKRVEEGIKGQSAKMWTDELI